MLADYSETAQSPLMSTQSNSEYTQTTWFQQTDLVILLKVTMLFYCPKGFDDRCTRDYYLARKSCGLEYSDQTKALLAPRFH
jgi:hypothetical protein